MFIIPTAEAEWLTDLYALHVIENGIAFFDWTNVLVKLELFIFILWAVMNANFDLPSISQFSVNFISGQWITRINFI